MCTRFLAARANVIDTRQAVGLEDACQHVGFVAGGVAHDTTSSVGQWQMASIEATVSEAIATAAADEAQISVLTLGVETPNERKISDDGNR
jgi:hypothetical protein